MARRTMSAGNPLPAMACYHCQQCAEKYLKGFLVSRSIEFRPVHDPSISYSSARHCNLHLRSWRRLS